MPVGSLNPCCKVAVPGLPCSVWLSPLFPKLSAQSAGSAIVGDSITLFKKDLLQYLAAYKLKALEEWMQHIREHDLSAAR